MQTSRACLKSHWCNDRLKLDRSYFLWAGLPAELSWLFEVLSLRISLSWIVRINVSSDNHHTVIVSIVTPFRQQHLHFLVPDPRRVSSGQIEKCTLSKRFAQFLRKTCISFYEYVQEAERNKLRSEAKTCLVYNRKWREAKTLSVCAQNGTKWEHDDQKKGGIKVKEALLTTETQNCEREREDLRNKERRGEERENSLRNWAKQPVVVGFPWRETQCGRDFERTCEFARKSYFKNAVLLWSSWNGNGNQVLVR